MTSRAAAVTLCLLAAACASPSRNSGASGRAVVVWEPSRAADAEAAKAAIDAHGWEATTVPAGVAHRTRSSLAIYGQGRKVGRGKEVADFVDPVVGEIEVLPFLTPGPGGNDAVLWLADR